MRSKRLLRLLASVLALAWFSTIAAQTALANRWYSKAEWTPAWGDTNDGGEYQADVPDISLTCTANTKGMVVKTMWAFNTSGSGSPPWVEHGWFQGLGKDGNCYNSGSFCVGWKDIDTGYYDEHRYTNHGSLTVGDWNTFRLIYIGYIDGGHWWRTALNGNTIVDVYNGPPYQTDLHVGFESDDYTACLDARTDVEEWKKYKYSDGSWGYPESADLEQIPDTGTTWMPAPVWVDQYHDMKWNDWCGI